MYNFPKIADFLKLEVPAPVEEKDTFLSIAGFPHYENVISNIYAYYFDQEKDHGFKDLFLQALLSLLQKKKYGTEELLKKKLGKWSKWSVNTEVQTQKGRIDIYLVEESEEEQKCILIENKYIIMPIIIHF